MTGRTSSAGGDGATQPASPPTRDELIAGLERAIGGRLDPSAVRTVRAPGRVNLIGEHTDYNEGFVLPAAIDMEIRVAAIARPPADRTVTLTTVDGDDTASFELDAIGPPRGRWIDYPAGVARALADAGIATRPIRGVVTSTLPRSSGLSSSAALELASAWALGTHPSAIDPVELARLCQRAENGYVGVQSGLMDQFASAMGRAGAAVLLDCRSLEWRPVPLPLDRAALVVVHTGSTRSLGGSEYNARRAQCEHGVAVIARRNPDVRSLRDVDTAMLEAARGDLDETTFRRCEHVVRENERVLETVAALEVGDLEEVGRLWVASHASLRDLFEVSSPALDALVEIALGVPGVFGARMTGGGFGGCIVALVARDAVGPLAEAIRRDYPARTGLEPRVWTVTPTAGAGPVD